MAGLMDYLSGLLPQIAPGAQGQSYAAPVTPPANPGIRIPATVSAQQIFGGTRPTGLGLPSVGGPAMGTPMPPAAPATPSGYGAGVAVGGAIGGALAPRAPWGSALAPNPHFAEGLSTIANFGRGMVGLAPSVPTASVATPIARDATGDATAVAAAAVPQGPGRQLSPGPNGLAPLAEMPPVAAAAPAPSPEVSARNHLADIITQQHDPRILSALMGGLPRQPMPQEIAQQKMMKAHDQVFNDEMASALKMTDPNAQAIAKTNAYEKYIKSMRVIATPGYGMIGYGQEDKVE